MEAFTYWASVCDAARAVVTRCATVAVPAAVLSNSTALAVAAEGICGDAAS
jgi:hypothetical protein